MKWRLLLTFVLISKFALGQQTGQVDYPNLGISFTIPENWVGQEQQGFYLMGSNTIPGYLLITTHYANSIEQLQQEAANGFNDQAMQLYLEGEVEKLDNQSIGGFYSGTVEYQSARAYVIGVVNPHGQGVVIMATTTTEKFNDTYRNLALQLRKGLTFYKGKSADQLAAWKTQLTHTRLTYMDSYYSPSTPGNDIAGGYSTKIHIDLCSGYFGYYKNSQLSMGGDDSSAYSHSSGNGSGNWELMMGTDGSPILLLNFYNGEQQEYQVTEQNGSLYLNGHKYYRTSESLCN